MAGKPIDFKTLVRGIPNHVVTRLLSEATPGVDFVGCSKATMLEDWTSSSPHASTRRTDREEFARLVAEWRKEQADKLERERAAALPVKPGDKVTVFSADRICEITQVAQVDRARGTITIVTQPDAPYALDGKLLRRKCALDHVERIEVTTEKHRQALRRQTLIYKLIHAPWHRLSEQQMQQVLDMVEKTGRKE